MAEQEEKAVGKNCSSCNKPLKRDKRYYRNGRYFCNKNCFKTYQEKAEKEKSGQKTEEKETQKSPPEKKEEKPEETEKPKEGASS